MSKVNPSIPGAVFPILVEVSHEGHPDVSLGDHPDGHPTDVYRAEYFAGENPEDDSIVLLAPVAESPGDDCQPAALADGRTAFISDRDGRPRLYVAKPGQERPDVLVDQPGLIEAQFSPDGHGMAYLVAGADKTALFLAGADGSDPRQAQLNGLDPSELCYTPDGSSLVFSHIGYKKGEVASGLFRLEPTSGQISRLSTGADYYPSVSPDGKHVAYMEMIRRRNGHSATVIYVQDLESGKRRIVSDDVPESCFNIAYTPDGSRLILSTGETEDIDGDDVFWGTPYVLPIPAKGKATPIELEVDDGIPVCIETIIPWPAPPRKVA